MNSLVLACTLGSVLLPEVAASQAFPEHDDTRYPTATQWTLDASGPLQRANIKSVFLVHCLASQMKGTGFLIENGWIVTNNHVIFGCASDQIKLLSPAGKEISITKMISDPNVDLAILKPESNLRGGLKLYEKADLPVGTAVSTWGYPLQFNGPNPLLSTGFIAGYMEDGVSTKVKHLVINGAINPGNSGGPLLKSGDDRVVGIVVAKFLPYTPSVVQIIQAMSQNRSGVMYTVMNSAGTPQMMAEGQLVSNVLREFYQGTQVMIGEAISVTELQSLLRTHRDELK